MARATISGGEAFEDRRTGDAGEVDRLGGGASILRTRGCGPTARRLPGRSALPSWSAGSALDGRMTRPVHRARSYRRCPTPMLLGRRASC